VQTDAMLQKCLVTFSGQLSVCVECNISLSPCRSLLAVTHLTDGKYYGNKTKTIMEMRYNIIKQENRLP